MVIPFLSLYLVEDKGFSKPQVGWIMSCFGLGSLAGTWVGGKLTDRFGFHKVILASLFFGGLGFIALQFVDSFAAFCIGVFIAIFVVDAYRPAIFVACDAYCKPENITRGITLIRLAINLGFSIGPLVGGLIIAGIGYIWLFWIDGFTCILAALLLYLLLKPKQLNEEEKKEAMVKEGVPYYKNGLYLLLIFTMIWIGTLFVQYFSLVPLYYKEIHLLSEDLIGALLFLNGIMIVLFEMPLVGWLERKKLSKSMATFWGTLFLAFSFLVMNISDWGGILIIGMVLMTLGEMVQSPFSNALALSMAPKGRKGNYMALYSMSFSVGHIFGHNGGMNLVNSFNYEISWYLFFGILCVISLLVLVMRNGLKRQGRPY